MNQVDIIGYSAGLFLMISFLPQVLRTLKTRRADDISLLLLACTLCSGLLYELYAAMLGLYPVVVMNGVFTLLVFWQLSLTLRYRFRAQRVRQRADAGVAPPPPASSRF